jgi:hypothetical protein
MSGEWSSPDTKAEAAIHSGLVLLLTLIIGALLVLI